MGHSQLTEYYEKYKSKLKPKNTMYIKQILHIIQSLMKFIKSSHKSEKQGLNHFLLTFLQLV